MDLGLGLGLGLGLRVRVRVRVRVDVFLCVCKKYNLTLDSSSIIIRSYIELFISSFNLSFILAKIDKI